MALARTLDGKESAEAIATSLVEYYNLRSGPAGRVTLASTDMPPANALAEVARVRRDASWPSPGQINTLLVAGEGMLTLPKVGCSHLKCR